VTLQFLCRWRALKTLVASISAITIEQGKNEVSAMDTDLIFRDQRYTMSRASPIVSRDKSKLDRSVKAMHNWQQISLLSSSSLISRALDISLSRCCHVIEIEM
jgi:hypothetical protein